MDKVLNEEIKYFRDDNDIDEINKQMNGVRESVQDMEKQLRNAGKKIRNMYNKVSVRKPRFWKKKTQIEILEMKYTSTS